MRLTDNESYFTKHFFIWAGDAIMEVPKKEYNHFAADDHREAYIDKSAREVGVVSLDELTSQGIAIREMIADPSQDVSEIVERKIMVEALLHYISLLPREEQALINSYYFDNKTQKGLTKVIHRNQSNVSRKVQKILSELRYMMENMAYRA